MHLIDPPVFFPYEDGSHAFLHYDMDRHGGIDRAAERAHDAARFSDWVDLWTRATGLVQPYMLTDPPTLSDVWERAKASGDEAVLERFPHQPRSSISRPTTSRTSACAP